MIPFFRIIRTYSPATGRSGVNIHWADPTSRDGLTTVVAHAYDPRPTPRASGNKGKAA